MSTEYTRVPSPGIGALPALYDVVTVASGQGTLKQGQILARADDGDYYKLVRESVATDEDTGHDGAASEIHLMSAHPHIIPGSLSIDVEGAAVANNATDAGADGVLKLSAGTRVGSVDYLSGKIYLKYAANLAAGDVELTYRYLNVNGRGVPAGILIDYEADTATSEQAVTMLVLGQYRESGVIFPTNITDENMARIIEQLRAARIYLV